MSKIFDIMSFLFDIALDYSMVMPVCQIGNRLQLFLAVTIQPIDSPRISFAGVQLLPERPD
jgi:hypothetical protein